MHNNNQPTVANDSSIPATIRSLQATRQTAAVTVGLVLGLLLLMTLAAQVRIPVPGTEVPMTLQLLVVLTAGLLLTPNQSAAGLSSYVLLGTAGLPVLSPGSAGLWGPTGGYLVGFIPAAWLMGILRGRNDSGVSRLLAAGSVGVVVVFVCGIGWRMIWLGGDWRLALQTGLLPFALKAIVELCLAVAVVLTIHRCRKPCSGMNVSGCVG